MAKKKKETKTQNKKEKVKIKGLKGGQRIKAIGEMTAEPTTDASIKEIGKEEKSGQVEGEEKKSGEKKRKKKTRGKAFLAAKGLVDKNKFYSLPEAVALVKKTSTSKFVGKLEAHLVVGKTGQIGEANLPYLTSKKTKVAVADEKLVAQLEKGKIDFDVLLASPDFMPKLVPFARVLGPKGLMPNPKNGTLVKDPTKAVKKFASAGVKIKTEKKAPVVHLVVGSLEQKDKELVANIEALIKAVEKQNIKKMVLSATMGPGIKLKHF